MFALGSSAVLRHLKIPGSSDKLEEAINLACEGDGVCLEDIPVILQEPEEEEFGVLASINFVEVVSHVHSFGGVAKLDLLDVDLVFLTPIFLLESKEIHGQISARLLGGFYWWLGPCWMLLAWL